MEQAGVNAARPAPCRSGLCGLGCRAFVIQHNAALRETGRRGGPQRVTRIMSAPGGVGALRGCIGSGVRLAPAFSILARRGAKLRWRSALLLAAVRILSHGSPPSLAAPVRCSGHVIG